MKNTIAVLLIIFSLMSSVSTLYAQERIREAGLSFSSFNSFGLTYRVGSPSALWRFNSAYLSGQTREEVNAPHTVAKVKDAGFALNAGREFRKDIFDNVQLRYGADINFSYTYYRNSVALTNYPDHATYSRRTSYSPGVSAVLGLNYLIKDKLVIGAEIRPGISYIKLKHTEKSSSSEPEEVTSRSSGFAVHASTSSAALTLALRF